MTAPEKRFFKLYALSFKKNNSIVKLFDDIKCPVIFNPCNFTPWNPAIPKPFDTKSNNEVLGKKKPIPIKPKPCTEPPIVPILEAELAHLENIMINSIQLYTKKCTKIGIPEDNDNEIVLETDDKYNELLMQAKLLKRYGNSTKLQVNLADAYIKLGKYEKGRSTMDQVYTNAHSSRKKQLCLKRAVNELKVQKGLNKWTWRDMPEAETKLLQELTTYDNAVGNEANAIWFNNVKRKPYFVKVKIPKGAKEIVDQPVLNIPDTKPTDNVNVVQLYPNPANTYINLKSDNIDLQEVSLNIIDINGNKQPLVEIERNEHNTKLDVSKLQSGLYIVIISNDQGIIEQHKFMKL